MKNLHGDDVLPLVLTSYADPFRREHGSPEDDGTHHVLICWIAGAFVVISEHVELFVSDQAIERHCRAGRPSLFLRRAFRIHAEELSEGSDLARDIGRSDFLSQRTECVYFQHLDVDAEASAYLRKIG